jgi:hypothetical protein
MEMQKSTLFLEGKVREKESELKDKERIVSDLSKTIKAVQ